MPFSAIHYRLNRPIAVSCGLELMQAMQKIVTGVVLNNREVTDIIYRVNFCGFTVS